MLLGLTPAHGLLAEEMPPPRSPALAEGNTTVELSARALDRAMRNLVDRWRMVLDQPDSVPQLSTLLETHPLQLDLVQGSFRTLRELQTWITDRQQTLASSQYTISKVEAQWLDQQTLRLEFEYAVVEKTVDGPPEWSRIRAIWRVDYRNPDKPRILEMSEHYLPPAFNSGARIQC